MIRTKFERFYEIDIGHSQVIARFDNKSVLVLGFDLQSSSYRKKENAK